MILFVKPKQTSSDYEPAHQEYVIDPAKAPFNSSLEREVNPIPVQKKHNPGNIGLCLWFFIFRSRDVQLGHRVWHNQKEEWIVDVHHFIEALIEQGPFQFPNWSIRFFYKEKHYLAVRARCLFQPKWRLMGKENNESSQKQSKKQLKTLGSSLQKCNESLKSQWFIVRKWIKPKSSLEKNNELKCISTVHTLRRL